MSDEELNLRFDKVESGIAFMISIITIIFVACAGSVLTYFIMEGLK